MRTLNSPHPFVNTFMAAISYAMYAINTADKARVITYLKKVQGKSDDFISSLPQRYWHKHPAIRRYLKPKGQMEKDTIAVFKHWLDANLFVDGKNFFTEGIKGTEYEFNKIIALMSGGYLSDPVGEGIEIYHKVHTIKKTLDWPEEQQVHIYRCVRGTSQLEGYHSHLHKATRDCSQIGPQLAEAKLMDFNFRFAYSSLVKNTDAFDTGFF